MSIKMMSQAWDSPLKGNPLLTLLAMCDFANDEGDLFPSLKTLAAKARVSKSTLAYILKAFESLNIITREKRKRNNGSDTSTMYKINHFDFTLEQFEKAYQVAYKHKSSPKIGHGKVVQKLDTQNQKLDTQNQKLDTQNAKIGHLEPSTLNRQVINHQQKCDLKPKDIISFYKENISNLESKVLEIKSTNALALIPDNLETVLIGLKNYANDLPKDDFYIRTLTNFIKDKVYLDYQSEVKTKPKNSFDLSGKKYEDEEF